jgi:hypothetical protein
MVWAAAMVLQAGEFLPFPALHVPNHPAQLGRSGHVQAVTLADYVG